MVAIFARSTFDTILCHGRDLALSLFVCSLAVLAFAAVDMWFPISIAHEELIIVALLGLLEVGRRFPLTAFERHDEKCAPTSSRKRIAQHSTVGAFLGRLQAAAKVSDTVTCEAIMAEMQEACCQPTVICYGAVISAFGRKSDAKGASRWLQALIDADVGRPNVISLNIVLSACAKSGDVRLAEDWMRRVSALGIETDIMSFNTMIDAYARLGDLARAEHWFTQVRMQRGLSPNIVSFSTLLNACAKAGDANSAEYWLKRMAAEHGIEPNTICYNAVIHSWAKAGNVDRAMFYLTEMQACGLEVTVNSFGAIIDRLAKDGRTSVALEWLDKMSAAGVEADVVCYNMILGGFTRSRDAVGALRLLNRMCSQGIEPSTASLNEFSKIINVHNVGKLLKDCESAGVDVNGPTLQLLLSSVVASKDSYAAEALLERLHQKAVNVDASSYINIIEGYLNGQKSSDVAQAARWLCRMEAAGFQASPHIIGQLSQAASKLGDASILERLVGKVKANSHMFNAIISCHAKHGNAESAEYWLQTMLKEGLSPDVATYSSVVHACAKSNDLARAEDWVDRMEASGVHANTVTLNSVINACARCGRVDRAEVWLERMEERGLSPGILTYNSMINACAKAGQPERAETWLREMTTRGVHPDAVSYSTVIHAWTAIQEPAHAEVWLQELEEALHDGRVCHGQPSTFCFNTVIQAWLRQQNVSRASEVARMAAAQGVEVSSANLNALASLRQDHGPVIPRSKRSSR